MDFERVLKDPENINPPFQPNVDLTPSKKRTLSKTKVKEMLQSMDEWQKRKQAKIIEAQSKH